VLPDFMALMIADLSLMFIDFAVESVPESSTPTAFLAFF